MTVSPNTSKLASVRDFSVKRVDNGSEERIVDSIAVEEPLGIHLCYWNKGKQVTANLAVTMRTPGHDFELATGYLLSEGVVRTREDIVDLRTIGSGEVSEVAVELAPAVDVDAWQLGRNSLVASACGICGKRMLEAIPAIDREAVSDELIVHAEVIERLPDLLRERQQGFAQTGGLHAAALVSAEGATGCVFEDIGRHNALDKLIGHETLRGSLPLARQIVFMSSRGSYELVQKAATAGAQVLATVGGPSSLAVEAARGWGMTLIGFVRARRFNVYSGEWRVRLGR